MKNKRARISFSNNALVNMFQLGKAYVTDVEKEGFGSGNFTFTVVGEDVPHVVEGGHAPLVSVPEVNPNYMDTRGFVYNVDVKDERELEFIIDNISCYTNPDDANGLFVNINSITYDLEKSLREYISNFPKTLPSTGVIYFNVLR